MAGSGHQRTACAPSDDSPAATAIERMAYTVEEAASMLGIGRDLIYDEIRNRGIGARQLPAQAGLVWGDMEASSARSSATELIQLSFRATILRAAPGAARGKIKKEPN
jgi:hypothetical protein